MTGNAYDRIKTSERAQRNAIYQEAYDGLYGQWEQAALPATHPRRLKRIAVFKAIIGHGHERILEMGCGFGDLTLELAGHAGLVIGTDVSAKAIELAKKRKAGRAAHELPGTVDFLQMDAVTLKFPDGWFDVAISTSMIEHLHPDDVLPHLQSVRRVLKPGGRYIIWCPNRLGHHHARDGHLTEFSYGELMTTMSGLGFGEFRSTVFNKPPLVSCCFKAFLENLLFTLRVPVLWSHLGVRNILLVSTKREAR